LTKKIRRGRSIRYRLTAWYAGLMIAIFAGSGVLMFLAVRNAAEQTIDADLRARLAAVRENLPASLSVENATPLGEELEEQAATGAAGVWLQMADKDGHWLRQSDALKDDNQLPLSGNHLPPDGGTRTTTIRGKPFRILTAPVNGGIVQLGMPIGQFADMLEKFKWTLIFACPLLLALAAGGGYWMSGRALRPVDEIAMTVARINSENLAERLRMRGTDDELDRLSGLINQMLVRLESAFNRVAQFTADASHELRTPVAIIRTTGEVMQTSAGGFAEHQAEWIHVVGQARRMSNLIDDLLLLARTDASHSGLAFEGIDLADVVRAAVAEIKILLGSSDLTLTTSIPAACSVTGSADALRRVVLSLLDNAIKYTGAGGEITVRMTIAESRVVVEVCDTGVGIPANDLPHVFDRFYRVSADRSRQTGGAGLGLSIARSLTLLHGGNIEVESESGKGSVFRVILPLP
jgi:heavy metal sensor kinase